jgi:hypothetical protein
VPYLLDGQAPLKAGVFDPRIFVFDLVRQMLSVKAGSNLITYADSLLMKVQGLVVFIQSRG